MLARTKPFFVAAERVLLWLERRFASGSSREGKLGLDVESSPVHGINVVGYLRAEVGIGEVARRLVSAIEHQRIPCSTINYQRTASRQEFPFNEQAGHTAPYDTNLICVNPDQLPGFADAAGFAFFAGRYTIGVWFWEVEIFPEQFHDAFDLVDEVWAASDFVRDALAAVTTKPVNVVPLPLEASRVEPIERATLGLPDSFLFFYTFDFMSVAARKNPLGLVTAFKRAFEPGEGAALVIKSINGDRRPSEFERLRLAAADHADVHVIDGYLAPNIKDGLMAACDCYVSLHRSEGLGLTMAEAMSYARPVIATGYSGNLTFMDDENSYLVPYTRAPVPPGCDPYPVGAVWAEPDLERAAALMRHVYENRAEARKQGERGRRDIESRHSAARTAGFIARRLDEIYDGPFFTGRPHVASQPVSSSALRR